MFFHFRKTCMYVTMWSSEYENKAGKNKSVNEYSKCSLVLDLRNKNKNNMAKGGPVIFFFSKMLALAWMEMTGKCWYLQRNQLINNLASVFPAEPGKAKLDWKIHWQGFNYDFNNEAWTNLSLPVHQLPPHAVFPSLMEGPWKSSLIADERTYWSV